MKYALFITIMMYGLVCNAGICKHVSGNGETDNRSIFRIQQDVCGYMWFLTYNGINRYDGTSLKHYDLQADNDSIDFYSVNSELFIDNKKRLGKHFRKELFTKHYVFLLFYKLQKPWR